MAMTMRVLKVFDLVGEFAIDDLAGEKVFAMLHPELLAGHSVELDFEGVRVVAPPFLSVALGKLFQDISATNIDRFFTATNLSQLDRTGLELVVESSKRYFTDPVYRAAVGTANAKVAAGEYDR